MAHISISADGPVRAPPGLVYGLLADYQQHHPRILPDAFSDLKVEQGGIGAGTVATFRLKLAGRTFPSRIQVTGPGPGRVLQESDGRITTRFTVTPEGDHTRVRIDTAYESPGLQGLMEQLLVPRMLKKLYHEELSRLDTYAGQQSNQA